MISWLGTLYSQTGRAVLAHVALSSAIEMSRAIGMAFWLSDVESVLAEVER